MHLGDPSNWLPFFLTAGSSRLNVQRIIEAVIIAGISGGVTMYGAQKMLVTRLENMDRNIMRLEKRQERMFNDLYRPRVSPLEQRWQHLERSGGR